jgi:hypothetical protein
MKSRRSIPQLPPEQQVEAGVSFGASNLMCAIDDILPERFQLVQ